MGNDSNSLKIFKSGGVNEIEKLKCGYHIAIIGLGIAAIVAIFMMFFNFNESSEIVAVIGVFTSVTGTIVGAFIGVEIGAAESSKTNLHLEREKTDINNYITDYKRGISKKLKEIDTEMSKINLKEIDKASSDDLEEIRAMVNRMMSSSNYILDRE